MSHELIDDSMRRILRQRKDASLYRYLQLNKGLIDFCSNDYLSFARSIFIQDQVRYAVQGMGALSGATGSRSISGNTAFAEELEQFIASFHGAEDGLLFNSGYDANLGLFSCIANRDDTIICDKLVHASIIDGCRLSHARRLRFAHNDTDDLEKKLQQASGNIFVAVESVYSMDGDMAPLEPIVSLCKQYNANLVVDEAHATGVFGEQGRGLVHELGLHNEVFARVHTFGKAIGSHGAIVLGSNMLRNYLINFARSFIFTTALPLHSLVMVRCAYEQLLQKDFSTIYLHQLITEFKNGFTCAGDMYLIESDSPVQSLIVPGNKRVKDMARQLQSWGYDIRAIVSPSVPPGKERLRISLHMHNTPAQVKMLKQSLQQILFQ